METSGYVQPLHKAGQGDSCESVCHQDNECLFPDGLEKNMSCRKQDRRIVCEAEKHKKLKIKQGLGHVIVACATDSKCKIHFGVV